MLRDEFVLPPDTVYLDGNSLGPLPRAARDAVERRLGEWETAAVRGWEGWLELAESLAPRIARLVGALPSEVVATGSITVNLHALLATFHRPEGRRRNLLVTSLDLGFNNGPSSSSALPPSTYEALEPATRNEVIRLLQAKYPQYGEWSTPFGAAMIVTVDHWTSWTLAAPDR